MPRKSYYRKTDPLKFVLSKGERLIVTLQKKAGSFKSDDDNERAFTLLKIYTIKGEFSHDQWRWVRELNQRPSRRKAAREAYLYAISAGDSVKLGLSANPNQRLKEMQTGNAESLAIAWKIGPVERKKGYKLEKKLHRLCRNYAVTGEWFKAGCMELVRGFTLDPSNRSK